MHRSYTPILHAIRIFFKCIQIGCKAVTALIQYFFLSAFCWMMCEGVMLYLMLVMVFSTLSKKWWFFLLLGWGRVYIYVIVHEL